MITQILVSTRDVVIVSIDIIRLWPSNWMFKSTYQEVKILTNIFDEEIYMMVNKLKLKEFEDMTRDEIIEAIIRSHYFPGVSSPHNPSRLKDLEPVLANKEIERTKRFKSGNPTQDDIAELIKSPLYARFCSSSPHKLEYLDPLSDEGIERIKRFKSGNLTQDDIAELIKSPIYV